MSDSNISYDEKYLEEQVIEKIKALDYEYIDPRSFLEQRDSKQEIIDWKKLDEAIRRINKKIEDYEVNDIINKIQNELNNANLLDRNKKLLSFMVHGISIWNQKEEINKTRKIIDLDRINNNDFVVTNQLIVRSTHPEWENQIPDIVIYINGLPVVIIELKTMKSSNDILLEAGAQIQRYVDFIQDIFSFNLFSIISNGAISKIGTFPKKDDDFEIWRNEQFSSDIFDTIKFLLAPKNLFDLLRNFIFFTNKGNKIFPKYYQYFGIKKGISSIQKAWDENQQKAGIIWHTQGSGKSLSMVMLVSNLKKCLDLKRLTALVITDRKDLDGQLFNTFSICEDYLHQTPYQISSCEDLKKSLQDVKQDGVYFSTIQKFNDEIELSDRKDILIISDEAHRSHNNYLAIDENNEENNSNKPYSYLLRKAFPNAIFIGFTGTPIENKDVSTSEIFGDVIHKYTLSQATEDKSIVPINYENAQVEFKLDEEKLKLIDEQNEKENQEIKNNHKKDANDIIVKKDIKKIEEILQILQSDERIKIIVKHFIKHYEARRGVLKDKAMFVAMNRLCAEKYYHEILRNKPDWVNKIKLVITPNKKDSPELTKIIGSEQDRKNVINQFKDPNSEIKILIVVDMLLTGYDVPSLDVIYFDRVLKMHNLMQAMARVNRKYIDKDNPNIKKEAGLVVDYIGIFKRIQEALKFYWDGNQTKNKFKFEEKYQNVDDILANYNDALKNVYDKYFSDLNVAKLIDEKNYLALVDEVFNKSLTAEFIHDVKNIRVAYKMVISTLSEEIIERSNLLFATAAYIKNTNDGNVDYDEYNKALRESLKDSVAFFDIKEPEHKQIHKLVDIESFVSNIKKNEDMGNQQKKQMLFNRFLNKIKNSVNISIIAKTKLSQKLEMVFERFKMDSLSYEEFIQYIFNEFGDDLINDEIENNEEKFYVKMFVDAVRLNEDQSDEEIESIAYEIYDAITMQGKRLIEKSWLHSEANRKDVRRIIKEVLIFKNYPPENREKTSYDIVEQIEEILDNRGN
ncbi:type I restriction endonuclease subunit R [Ureaplasma urealyticum]|uniref:Type I restriction enzyme endonuclease subunit n=3 Tax=Ureaplasma urealyticum TaxID=2130 RepID=A0AAP9ABF7_UREUR|nr:type I restriction endonuclease subunit R [Ureaplasma urealyticum]EDX53175.1 type I restriction-modification system, R subunit [Ureaplasma urealyticum serovar 12 str. ATCC 33696]EDY74694.1 type I restriction-modification system, R subunit [Ureaplasma urealyticum serovar 4 str. ATCC 27816]MCF1348718.1 type I restriction endonuclease subunit R [Ureaplasma urealyticum]QDI63416.1 type I restriction endonuclease subunit R [Ureaplasma urealyticum]QDI64626.1 type I restriction endonuclease subunit